MLYVSFVRQLQDLPAPELGSCGGVTQQRHQIGTVELKLLQQVWMMSLDEVSLKPLLVRLREKRHG